MQIDYIPIDRKNNFDIIRLVAALQVAILHLKRHMGVETQYEWVFEILGYFPGVPIFFTVSGFLIAASWTRCPDIKKYSLNRFLRIYPGLYVCFIRTFEVLIYVGLINQDNIFSKQAMIWYFLSLFTIYPNITPPMLKQLQAGDPNGSLWTIPVELQFYILLPILLILAAKYNKAWLFFTIWLGSCLLYICKPDLIEAFPNSVYWKLIIGSVLFHFWNFCVGVILYLFWRQAQRFFVGHAFWWLIAYLVIRVIVLSVNEIEIPREINVIIIRSVLGCLVISFAFTQTAIARILSGYDISYGIYIYHMPIANAFIEKGFYNNQLIYYGALGIVIALAFVSWNYVEKICLGFKLR